jgi:ABC-2 type transport system ATP-binding protein
MQNLILKCENLHKNFRKKEILKGVSLEISNGDILGFIGPNGAGKTTTIKLILGLQKINSGKVEINGFDIKTNFEKAIAKVGAIIENPDLYMYMSGLDNLKLIANLYPSVTDKRILEVIKLVGLENRINDKVSKYSLGMRQRLGVAQAILHKPNLLILDEPTNGLDPEGIKDLRNLLIKLSKEENMGILISSHNLAELESFCNKVCIIKNGIIVETSDIDTVKKEASEGNYIIELDDAKRARLIIGDISIAKDNTHILVHAIKEDIPNIVKKLVLQDIQIYSITEEIISLEDAFLKKTGGNVID